jgi:hypothetical protein
LTAIDSKVDYHIFVTKSKSTAMKSVLYTLLICSFAAWSCQEATESNDDKAEKEPNNPHKENVTLDVNPDTLPVTDLPGAPPADLLGKFADQLDVIPKDIDGIAAAVDFYNKNLKGNYNCDEAFSQINAYAAMISQSLDPDSYVDKNNWEVSEETTAMLKGKGILVKYSEGTVYLTQDLDYVNAAFSNCLTAPMQKYVDQSAKEDREGFSEDAGLSIPLKDLGDRLLFWENFLHENPDFALKDGAQSQYKYYLFWFLNGMDNTPAFDYSTKKLDPEFKAAFEYLKDEHGETATGKIAAKYYELLAETDFATNERADMFLTTYKLSN